MTNKVSLDMRIIDNGNGIPADKLENLFIQFQRLEEHEDINKQGTGLGLSICKTLVECMGGKIKVESEIGVGTSFSINIPTKHNCKFSP